jgi:prepilin-type N-terminal cleavage/methylation domain-containing protein
MAQSILTGDCRMNSAKPEKPSQRPSAQVALREDRSASQGFTLIELMIVIAIILILATIAVGRYQVSYEKAKEATLQQDLFVLRKAIQDYTTDKEAAPNSLDDLVTEHYIRIRVPVESVASIRHPTPSHRLRKQLTAPGSRGRFLRPDAVWFDPGACIRYDVFAGWSSLVARRAHNPEVVGSNPTPATSYLKYLQGLADFGQQALFAELQLS